ncbi:uncharacterized protein Tco025E_08232 [Trypanosoma conorhini]|uniref:Uncharacterized protein n=1 Tax=Trypanosoma conorhini TaxID=83891 RepID=A0A422NCZ9_9TRYP|nr:uncharacterized protein Tco025E_08232 [Trypanosoma conorhini]RNF03189.1 hypothetical protein Tco025E_08232 [Trypanosoma conorhini]
MKFEVEAEDDSSGRPPVVNPLDSRKALPNVRPLAPKDSGGSFRVPQGLSGLAKEFKEGLQRKASKLFGWGETPVREPRCPPGMYTVRQFQNNLVRALVAKDTVRFGGLLDKYKECCREGRIVGVPGCTSLSAEHDGGGGESAIRVVVESQRSLVDGVDDFTTGYTMTHLAVASGEQSFVHSCLEFGSAVHSCEDLNGDTALTLALWCQPEVAFAMLDRGREVDVTRVGARGRNLLHSAIPFASEAPPWPRRLEFMRRIVDEDSALASQKDSFGFTPAKWALENAAHFTSKEECMQIVRFLKGVEAANEEEKVRAQAAETTSAGHELVVGSPLRGTTAAASTVHREILFSDRVRLVCEGAFSRLICVALMFCLHFFLYAVDVADRGEEATYRDARWDFWFTVYNSIASSWNGSAFFMGMTHAGCAFGGAIVGACVYRYGFHVLLGRRLMRLQICGAQSAAERKFIRNCFGTYYASIYEGKKRGGYFAMVVGAVLGIYFGTKLYNALLYRFWPGQLSWALILPVLPGVDAVTALRGFWWAALSIDWYIFMFILDIMYQQGSLNIYLPHRTFGAFAAGINRVLLWRKKKKNRKQTQKQAVEKGIATVRMGIYWTLLIIGWTAIGAAFLGFELLYGPTKEVFVEPLIPVTWLGVPVVIACLCMFLECVAVAQEWTWPTFQENPHLFFPGLAVSTHHVYFLLLVVMMQWCLDLRIIQEHVLLMRGQAGGSSTKDIMCLCVAHIPALLGLLLLLLLILRSSLWLERWGSAGRALGLYSEHVCLNPCPLESEEALRLAKREKERFARTFSRSLYCRARMENMREKLRVRDAVKRVGQQLHVTPPPPPEQEEAGPPNSRSGEEAAAAAAARRDSLSEGEFIPLN